eukprot:scaffold1504_cov417-Prasinococcus_capsulatus_cf.AAC.76
MAGGRPMSAQDCVEFRPASSTPQTGVRQLDRQKVPSRPPTLPLNRARVSGAPPVACARSTAFPVPQSGTRKESAALRGRHPSYLAPPSGLAAVVSWRGGGSGGQAWLSM